MVLVLQDQILNESVSFSPNAARVASSTILISVTLLKNGTVRLERGFTSITYIIIYYNVLDI